MNEWVDRTTQKTHNLFGTNHQIIFYQFPLHVFYSQKISVPSVLGTFSLKDGKEEEEEEEKNKPLAPNHLQTRPFADKHPSHASYYCWPECSEYDLTQLQTSQLNPICLLQLGICPMIETVNLRLKSMMLPTCHLTFETIL